MSRKPERNRLESLGLHRRELRAWALYDWANSAFATTVMGSVLPIFFHDVAAADLPSNLRTSYWAYTQSIALVVIALISPVLGAIGDSTGKRKRFLAGFAFAGILATSMLALVSRGEWILASLLFILGNLGFAGGNVFYESLLPHVARRKELNRVSTAGYAVGYLGGGILLAINFLWISAPQRFGLSGAEAGAKLSFLSVAVWWATFSIPLFRRVHEPDSQGSTLSGFACVREGFTRILTTLREIRRYRQAFLFLAAFWLYSDGIWTVIKMASIYGREIGIGATSLMGAFLLVQFVGIPFSFLFGMLGDRIGVQKSLYLALCIYVVISVFGYFMSLAWHFWTLALAVATVQGGSQALSRSLFASLIPRSRSSEFFGFYSVSARFAGILGPLVFGVVSQITGASRYGILSLIVFFIGGMLILSRVDPAEGARQAEA